jgi:phage shock protein PspC (stress-responsive transcriptional regulator)/predicted membrane protein
MVPDDTDAHPRSSPRIERTTMSTTDTPAAAPPKELHRSREDRLLAGVAGGLGRYFDISPNFFRAGFAILTLVGGAGILLYLAAALVIPEEGRADSIAAEALKRHRDRPWLLVGVALVGIAFLSLVAQADLWPDSGFAWTLLVIGVITIAIAQRGRGEPRSAETAPGSLASEAVTEPLAPPAPRPPSLLVPVLGLLLAAAGLLAFLGAVGVDIRWDLALAVAATAVGVAVVAGAFLRRRTGGLVVVGLTLAGLALAVSATDIRLQGTVGDRMYRPAAAEDVSRSYEMAVGELDLDLSDTALSSGDTRVDVNVGIGDLTITVPQAVAVDVEATASAGSVSVFGRQRSGVDSELTASGGGAPPHTDKKLLIDAHVGLGSVTVVRDRG